MLRVWARLMNREVAMVVIPGLRSFASTNTLCSVLQGQQACTPGSTRAAQVKQTHRGQHVQYPSAAAMNDWYVAVVVAGLHSAAVHPACGPDQHQWLQDHCGAGKD